MRPWTTATPPWPGRCRSSAASRSTSTTSRPSSAGTAWRARRSGARGRWRWVVLCRRPRPGYTLHSATILTAPPPSRSCRSWCAPPTSTWRATRPRRPCSCAPPRSTSPRSSAPSGWCRTAARTSAFPWRARPRAAAAARRRCCPPCWTRWWRSGTGCARRPRPAATAPPAPCSTPATRCATWLYPRWACGWRTAGGPGPPPCGSWTTPPPSSRSRSSRRRRPSARRSRRRPSGPSRRGRTPRPGCRPASCSAGARTRPPGRPSTPSSTRRACPRTWPTAHPCPRHS
mmetsp:Transcript_13420/g.21275  ORF Transcript_13420/g.21275 Transcript_13420/m.21275 type:complete len:287 (-) Transcript_13420:334-1194(-)